MTPMIFAEYGAALAGSIFLCLLVISVFAGAWLYIVGKGRE